MYRVMLTLTHYDSGDSDDRVVDAEWCAGVPSGRTSLYRKSVQTD